MEGQSWMIRKKGEKRAILEANDVFVKNLNKEKYEAIPVQEYLAEFNKAVKAAGGVQPEGW